VGWVDDVLFGVICLAGAVTDYRAVVKIQWCQCHPEKLS